MGTSAPKATRGSLKPAAPLARLVQRTFFQKVAAGWCLVMALFLVLVQLAGDSPPPLPLFLLFMGVWLFGAAMLWWSPLFGALGTAAYGVLLGAQLLAMHGLTPLTLSLAAASFAATGLALGALLEVRRARRGAAA